MKSSMFKRVKQHLIPLSFASLFAIAPSSSSAESLTRTYSNAAVSSVESVIQGNSIPLASTVNDVAESLPVVYKPLDAEHEEAILDALMPAMGLPGPLNHAVNCFIASQGNGDLFIISKYVKGECGVDAIDLIFDYNGTLTIPEARLLILGLVDGLIYDINNQTKLHKYFNVYPITPEQVAIRIRVNPPNCGLSYPKLGNIASILAIDNVISYGTLNSFTHEIDILRTESYNQAEEIASR